MNRQRRAPWPAFMILLALSDTGTLVWASAENLTITAPTDGTLVHSGEAFVIEVKADASAFRAIGVIGESPLSWTDARTAPPYRFTLSTPTDFPSGVYKLTASGITQSGDQVYSESVKVDVERPDNPKQLLTPLTSIAFSGVGDESDLRILGVFGDGSRVGLSHSTRTRYSSGDPSVVKIGTDGIARAAGPGFADITVVHGSLKLVIPVAVPREKRP